MPRRLRFGPLDGGVTEDGIISMTIEEYENAISVDANALILKEDLPEIKRRIAKVGYRRRW